MVNQAFVERIRLSHANPASNKLLSNRFRRFLPVIVDLETSGFEPARHAILEIAIVIPAVDQAGRWHLGTTRSIHVQPFAGAEFDATSLAFNKIDPFNPFRQAAAIDEKQALEEIFELTRQALSDHGCSKAVWVGHNVAFDLGFLNAAVCRTRIKKSPFHSFTAFDTATLSALMLGQTVLAKSLRAAGFDWDNQSAHTALYDAERTAQLFCWMLNRWSNLTALEQVAAPVRSLG
jgi:ribonuclease T